MTPTDPPEPPFPEPAGAPHNPARPLHLSPSALALVFVGGGAGTLARFGVALLLPDAGRLPISVLTVNVVGAFLLGALIVGLAARGVESTRGRTLRLLLGTGFMGGFTTYSSLAVGTTQLISAGAGWLAVGYSLATLVVGLAASLLGMAVGRRLVRPRTSPRSGSET